MKELLKKLFIDYYKEIYTYLYSLSHDASLSEELASEVFLEVVKSVADFRGESDIKTWLFSIARHKWYAYLRQKKDGFKQKFCWNFMKARENHRMRGIAARNWRSVYTDY